MMPWSNALSECSTRDTRPLDDPAADDFERLVERIREDNPSAAQRVAQTIYNSVAALRTFPHRGPIGLAPDTLELVFAHGLTSSSMKSSRTMCRFSAFAMLLKAGPKFY
jgi:hypothetical protein